MGWTTVAVLVLRQVWRRERVLEPNAGRGPSPRERFARRFPRLGRSYTIPPVVVLGVLAMVVAVALIVTWVTSDASGRYYLVTGLVVGTVATSLAVWNEL